MPALMAIIGANANQFRNELKNVEAMSKQTGSQIKNNIEGGTSAAHGKSTAFREVLVLMRELARGDFKRAASSATILVGQLGLMKFLLNPITAAVVGLAAGFGAAYKLSAHWIESLTGLKVPEARFDSIAKSLQKINANATAQRDINKEVQRTVDLYNSAAEAAKRNSEVTKEHFEHLRKMNNYEEEKEMKHAKYDSQRREIRERYAANDLKISDDERAKKQKDKQDEFEALAKEAEDKKKQADDISVNSKQHDEELLKQSKDKAAEGQKYIDENQGKKRGFFSRLGTGAASIGEAALQGRIVSGAVNGQNPTNAELDASAAQKLKDAHDAVLNVRDVTNRNEENERQRKEKERLNKDSEDAAKKAATALLESKQMQKDNARRSKDEREESDAKLDAQNESRNDRRETIRGHLTSLQQIGAYSMPGQVSVLDVAKKSERHLASIDSKLERGGSFNPVRY